MILINLINNDAFVSAVTADACSILHLVCLFMKMHLLGLRQDSWLGSLCFLAQVVCMCEEYDSALSTPTEADFIGHFDWYRYIGKTQISVHLCSELPN